MLTGWYKEKMPYWAKVLLQIFCSAGVIYRILLFVDDCIAKKEEKNTFALIMGIIGCTGIGTAFFWVVDLINILGKKEYVILVEKKAK